jgi:hypothetical protein
VKGPYNVTTVSRSYWKVYHTKTKGLTRKDKKERSKLGAPDWESGSLGHGEERTWDGSLWPETQG